MQSNTPAWAMQRSDTHSMDPRGQCIDVPNDASDASGTAELSRAAQRSAQALRCLAAQGQCVDSMDPRGQSLAGQRQPKCQLCRSWLDTARATRPMAKHGGAAHGSVRRWQGSVWCGAGAAQQCGAAALQSDVSRPGEGTAVLCGAQAKQGNAWQRFARAQLSMAGRGQRRA